MNTNLLAIPDPTGIVDKISGIIDSFYGYPSWLMVSIACFILGFCLKRWSAFPNQAIPLSVILFGGALMAIMAPDHPLSVSSLRWKATNFIVGIIIGAGVWLFHNRIWKWLVARYPVLGNLVPNGFNTEMIKRSDCTTTPTLQSSPVPVQSAHVTENNIQETK